MEEKENKQRLNSFLYQSRGLRTVLDIYNELVNQETVLAQLARITGNPGFDPEIAVGRKKPDYPLRPVEDEDIKL